MRVLILGAYGFFGSRISAALARNPRLQLLLAGRDLTKATALAYQLGLTAQHAKRIDGSDPRLATQLKKLGVKLLIHTAGPFQQQDYHVAQAAIEAGCHYFDLADARDFVHGISRLDAAARAAQVAVVSGVSSLPALTCAVVDDYLPQFSRLDVIRTGISSGALVPGIATVRGIFSYCGKPFRALEDGRWIDVYGWLDRRAHEFPRPVGPRIFGRCDVPDLGAAASALSRHPHGELPCRLRQLHRTQAGRVAGAAGAGRAPEERATLRESLLLGGAARAAAGQRHRRHVHPAGGAEHRWRAAASSPGCCWPTRITARIFPARRRLRWLTRWPGGFTPPAGAMACMGLLTLDEILEPLKGLRIREVSPL